MLGIMIFETEDGETISDTIAADFCPRIGESVNVATKRDEHHSAWDVRVVKDVVHDPFRRATHVIVGSKWKGRKKR
jgi:hypothetical protein